MSEYKNCPNCDNIGFNVRCDYFTGDPEQEQCQFCYEEKDSIFNTIAALQAEVERLNHDLDFSRTEKRAIIHSILHTIGGEVEGNPTSEINYLQRLRELVDNEGLNV